MRCEVCVSGSGSFGVGGMICTASGCDLWEEVERDRLCCVGVPGGVPLMSAGGALGVGTFLAVFVVGLSCVRCCVDCSVGGL